MDRAPFVLLLAALLLTTGLTGCGRTDAGAGSVARHPDTAYTWAEWVARERPRRDGYDPQYHLGKGLPNMTEWRPEDFLSSTHLRTKHINACELPEAERARAMRLAGAPPERNTFDMVLSYARRGLPQAQGAMGWFCSQFHIDQLLEPGQMTREEALEWARKGAASGHPAAMYMLGQCMLTIGRHHRLGKAHWDLGPFWRDEAWYWIWRAVTEGLYEHALLQLPHSSIYPNNFEYEVARYQYGRLWQLQWVFRNGPKYSYGHTPGPLVTFQEYSLKDGEAVIEAGERAVERWLSRHRDVWRRIVQRPNNPSGSQVYCPGDPGHLKSFDFAGLNQALERYGLHVEPPKSAETGPEPATPQHGR